MKITIDIPERISHRETYIASMESDRTGLKQRLENQWRKDLRRYKPLTIPIRCEFCAYVGEAQWHCHNPESPQCHINVMPWNVCSKWVPNTGLLMFLRRAARDEWDRDEKGQKVKPRRATRKAREEGKKTSS